MLFVQERSLTRSLTEKGEMKKVADVAEANEVKGTLGVFFCGPHIIAQQIEVGPQNFIPSTTPLLQYFD
jgi:hypothetical protein